MDDRPPQGPNDTLPPPVSTDTQRFTPVRPMLEDIDTPEFNPDILRFKDERFALMGPDGFVRTDLRVMSSEFVDGKWMLTLVNPDDPDSANNSLTMSYKDFMKERARPIIETPLKFSGTK